MHKQYRVFCLDAIEETFGSLKNLKQLKNQRLKKIFRKKVRKKWF